MKANIDFSVYFGRGDENEGANSKLKPLSEKKAAAALKRLFSCEDTSCDDVQNYLDRLKSEFSCDFNPEHLAREIAYKMGAYTYLKQLKTYTFAIHISYCGDSEIKYPVTDDEIALIQEAVEGGDQLEDIEELSDLYCSVKEAARNQLAEDLDLGNENDLDPDDLVYTVDFT